MSGNDHTGKHFGRWTALYKVPHQFKWRCRCGCGVERDVNTQTLVNGVSTSCGCGRIGDGSTRRHGKSKTRVHMAWCSMHARCSNPSVDSFSEYGGRGIKVCDRWKSFENFYADMGNPPDGMSLDRKDTNGNYEPANCRWATLIQQARNKRTSLFLTHAGQTLHINEWAERLEIGAATIRSRLHREYPVEFVLMKTLPRGPNSRSRVKKATKL